MIDLASLRASQNSIPWSHRQSLAAVVASRRGGECSPDASKGLRERGIEVLSLPIETAACDEVVLYFTEEPCYGAHVPAQSDGVPRAAFEQRGHYGSFTLAQSLSAPHIAELATRPELVELAASYLGCTPALYGINTFWTFPSADRGLTHRWHRDQDDLRFLAVFVYWTDVAEGDGEFWFLEGTHDFETVERVLRERGESLNADALRRLGAGNGYGHDGLYERVFAERVRSFPGGAGTVIAADTFGLHRGSPPRSKPRLCTWIRFGLYDNPIYHNDRTRPVAASLVAGRIADDAETRRVTELVVDWSEAA